MPEKVKEAPQPANNKPVEIRGYVTDPKLVGYQILTNYESTYWGALVGNNAWRLFEVLRSFCHEGNNTCNPSIKTLMDILGLSDRRQLIGRVDTKPGKQRVLPGLIDVLQEYKLAYAEVKGEGPTLRYVFHVNLNPPALTPDQIDQLPESLQRKHVHLLERVAQTVQELDKIEERKTVKPKKTLPENIFSEGGGTVPPPPGTVPPPPGTVPPKQQPYNNNQEQQIVVVEKLIEKKIVKKKAEELAAKFSPELVTEKLELLEWRLDQQAQGKTRGRPIEDEAAWLIRAIEQDYKPPEKFLAWQRRREEVAHQQVIEQEQLEERKKQQQELRQRLREKSGASPDPRLEEIWRQTLADLKVAMTTAQYQTYLANSELLLLENGEAVIGFTVPYARDWVEKQKAPLVREALLKHLDNQQVALKFIALDQPQDSEPEPS